MHSAGGAGTLRGMTRRFAWLLTCFLFAGLSTPLHAEDKAPVKPLRVALYDAEGSTGKGVPRVKEILAKEKDVELIFFKPDDIRAGKLKIGRAHV